MEIIRLDGRYLGDREHRVSIRGSFSDWVTITSGVLQGSVSGSILFIIFINDMPDMTDGMLMMFADDTEITEI